MTPELLAAVRSGAELSRRAYRSYIDYEAKAAGIAGGVREAVQRADQCVPPMNGAEERLRFLMEPYRQTRRP